MKTPEFPEDHQRVMPYLVINEAEDFLQFMKDVFDAEEKMKFKSDEKTIAHAELTIGKSVVMVSGDTKLLPPCTAGGFIYVADADATFKRAIEAGAKEVLPVKDNPFGRSGGFEDPFGNTWWVKTYRSEE